MPVIEAFTKENAFLSNFHLSPVEFEGVVYPSVEHAFQAAKTVDPEERERVRTAKTPAEAKRRGRRVTLREGWDMLRIDVMYDLLKIKFSDRGLAGMLLETGDDELVEGNWWNDRFWGVCKGHGQNNLGKLLMKVRDELRK